MRFGNLLLLLESIDALGESGNLKPERFEFVERVSHGDTLDHFVLGTNCSPKLQFKDHSQMNGASVCGENDIEVSSAVLGGLKLTGTEGFRRDRR